MPELTHDMVFMSFHIILTSHDFSGECALIILNYKSLEHGNLTNAFDVM